jgi:hypothetical protein
MKLLSLLLGIAIIFCAPRGRNEIDQQVTTMEQLDSLYQSQWNLSQCDSANSAKRAAYLNDAEKKVIYYLNLVRLNPRLFADTYASGYKGSICCSNNIAFDQNEKSLISFLQSLRPMPVLNSDRNMYTNADCQATAVGKNLQQCVVLDFGYPNLQDR